ncbi:MAG: hypothetical protein WCF67_03180 [Chitinophagaceae bacterium]
MKKWFFATALMVSIAACKNDKAPDVSDIKVNLEVQRFEQDFFAIDTNNVPGSIVQLQKKYPTFVNDFLVNILGISITDTDTTATIAVKRFIADYKLIKDSVNKVFSSMDDIEEEVKQGLQFTKHYFPSYNPPQKLITFIGPLDAYYEASLGGYSDIITREALATGLQLHLGKNFSVYRTELGQRLYPDYISRRFEPAYIPVNCMKNIIDDLFPDNSADKPLVQQMIEKGKRMYVLDKLLPYTHDTLKIGYTKKQLEGCYENEGLIWNFFLKNNLLYNIDPVLNKNYVQDGPKTEELGDGSPGYIGLFVGWQIVKKFMESHADLSMQQLMQTDAKKVFEESKYKPR